MEGGAGMEKKAGLADSLSNISDKKIENRPKIKN